MTAQILGAGSSLMTGYLFNAKQSTTVFVLFALSFWLGALCWQGIDVTRKLSDVKMDEHERS
jgi:hypothetical protein